jgi:hypothetical protein
MVISVFLGGAIVWLLFFFGTKNMGENLGFFFLVIILNNFTIFFLEYFARFAILQK